MSLQYPYSDDTFQLIVFTENVKLKLHLSDDYYTFIPLILKGFIDIIITITYPSFFFLRYSVIEGTLIWVDLCNVSSPTILG